MTRLFILLAAIAATPAAAQRHAAELRCIYDSVDAATNARVGEKFFNHDRTPPGPAALLGPAARDCAIRHGWGTPELAAAGRYALSSAALLYARPWLAARGISPERLDEIYDTTPRAERLRVNGSPSLRRRTLALLAEAGADAHIESAANYIVMRRGVEQPALDWATLGRGQAARAH
jgi:hypothetical protein